MGQIGRFNEVVIDCVTYLQGNEHVSLQGMCVWGCTWVYISLYMCIFVVCLPP